MSREAMKQALEALESDPISHAGLVSRKQAITILRQELETKPALTPRLLFAMRNGVADMTIDQKQLVWPASRIGVTTINNHKDKSNERI